METKFTLTSLDKNTVSYDLGGGARPAESSFYAAGYGDFIAIEHHTMKSFNVKYAAVSAVTVNGATFTTDADAVKAINALDIIGEHNIVDASDPRVDGILGVIPSTATPQNPLVDTDKLNSSIQAMAAHKVAYNAAGNPFPTKAALLAATVFYREGAPYVPTEHDYLTISADESSPDSRYLNGQNRYVYDGAVWMWDIGVNERPFTAAESAALASNITSAKVQKYDDYASQLPVFTKGTIVYDDLYSIGIDFFGDLTVSNNGGGALEVTPNHSIGMQFNPGDSGSVPLSSEDTLIHVYGTDGGSQYYENVYAIIPSVGVLLRLYHGAGTVGP
jgi:hypothetical protein